MDSKQVIQVKGECNILTKEPSNIIAIRSRKWIISALLELMAEKKYDKITTQNIIERADLTRQTFYRHFKSKDFVLFAYIAQLYESLVEEVNKLEEKTFYAVLVVYFEFWKKHRDFLNLLNKTEFRYDPIECYHTYMEKILSTVENQICSEKVDTKYIQSFMAGGLGNIKNTWINDNYQESPEKLSEIIVTLLGEKH